MTNKEHQSTAEITGARKQFYALAAQYLREDIYVRTVINRIQITGFYSTLLLFECQVLLWLLEELHFVLLASLFCVSSPQSSYSSYFASSFFHLTPPLNRKYNYTSCAS